MMNAGDSESDLGFDEIEVVEALENKGMLYIEYCGFVGYQLSVVQDFNNDLALNEIHRMMNKFVIEAETDAIVKACVHTY